MQINRLKEEIEMQREELNKILIKNTNKDKIIKASEKLDTLINKYYSINLNKKIAD